MNVKQLYKQECQILLCWGISEFKKGYQSRMSIVKDEKGGLVAHSHSILNRWGGHFFQLLNAHRVNDIR